MDDLVCVEASEGWVRYPENVPLLDGGYLVSVRYENGNSVICDQWMGGRWLMESDVLKQFPGARVYAFQIMPSACPWLSE